MDVDKKRSEVGESTRNGLVAKCVMKIITHPIDYARFLVQVCYEIIIKLTC